MAMELLAAHDLTKVFPEGGRGQPVCTAGGVSAVRHFTNSLASGERVAVVGGSGCGKTTLSRLLAGHLGPTKGHVSLSGRRLHRGWLGQNAKFHGRVLLLAQELDSLLHPFVSVGTQLDELVRQRPGALDAPGLAAAVGLPHECLDRLPSTLSGGECRRVALAKVLAIGPEVLIADEPFASLDPLARAQMAGVLRGILESDRHPALLLVTHELELARELGQRILVMHRGMILEQMPVDRFTLAHPHHPYAVELLLAEAFASLDRDFVGRQVRAVPEAVAMKVTTGPRHIRCPFADECQLRAVGRFAACEGVPADTQFALGAGRTNCVIAAYLMPAQARAEGES